MSAVTFSPSTRSSWLYHRKWDLLFIIGSAVLVGFPLFLHYGIGVSTAVINIVVAGLIGGPHLYSTFTITFMDPNFRRQHRWFMFSALLIPFGVGYLAATNMTLLLTTFFFWASIHVLHQISFLNECYRSGNPLERTWPRRIVDYGMIFTSLYPIAAYKLVTDRFFVGGITIPVPEFVKGMWVVWLVSGMFALFLTLFVIRSVMEYRDGRLNVPATTLVGVTVVVAFFIPSFSNLDVAFQGFNTWHSFQYLALVWYINKLRKDRGEPINPVLGRFCGRGASWYAWNLGVTLLAGGTVVLLNKGFGVGWDQAYYSVVLGTLLMHYYQDHFVFTRFGAIIPERLNEPVWFSGTNPGSPREAA